jgi:hypothetical protein
MTRISFLTVQQNVAVLMAAMSSQTPNPVASLEEEYRRPWDGRAATVGTRRQTTGSEPAIDRSTKKPRRNPTMSSLQSIQGDGNGAGAGRVVTQLRTNDVLMGRGAPIAYYRGESAGKRCTFPWSMFDVCPRFFVPFTCSILPKVM